MVKIIVDQAVLIENPSTEIITFVKDMLSIDNPEYLTKIRLKMFIGRTPRKLYLYEVDQLNYKVPYGFKDTLIAFLDEKGIKYKVEQETTYNPIKIVDKVSTNLYDYQLEAVEEMMKHENGILVSPAGSGKTRMAMELIKRKGLKTLWLTNNLSLLTQSKKVAKEFIGNSLGEISGGKVNIQDITFATVQTMANLDLTQYRDTFGLVCVDEAHRVGGTPTKMAQFYKVLSNLNVKAKFGLTATLYAKENDISIVPNYMIGNTRHTIKKEDVPRVTAEHLLIECNTEPSHSYLKPDKTIDFNKLLEHLIQDETRNETIIRNLLLNINEHNIIITSRNEHINIINEMLNSYGIETRVVTGETKKAIREEYYNDFREGRVNFILSNYPLAKEGLDLPIANVIHLLLPVSDKATIIQTAGRVERTFEGKTNSYVYDYVDINFGTLINMYKTRRRHLNAR